MPLERDTSGLEITGGGGSEVGQCGVCIVNPLYSSQEILCGVCLAEQSVSVRGVCEGKRASAGLAIWRGARANVKWTKRTRSPVRAY